VQRLRLESTTDGPVDMASAGPFLEWINSTPSQVAMLAMQVRWSETMEASICGENGGLPGTYVCLSVCMFTVDKNDKTLTRQD
jgi:hypothetical protein